MNPEQVGKHTIHFRRASYHTCIFNKACAGTCECITRLSYPGLSSNPEVLSANT